VDFLRWDVSRKMRSDKKVELGQFLTPMPVARLMASMVRGSTPATHILDAGAGTGTLFAACVAELCQRPDLPRVITITAYEIDESNLYTGFLATAMRLLMPGGEMVAITPRSFCNGPYFKQFRQSFLRNMILQQLHLFESRQRAFQDDAVLQENVILHSVRIDET